MQRGGAGGGGRGVDEELAPAVYNFIEKGSFEQVARVYSQGLFHQGGIYWRQERTEPSEETKINHNHKWHDETLMMAFNLMPQFRRKL